MPRRRRPIHEEEHDNQDRWLISYADFITLLFAFFVVMYAISSVSEGKYRVLSGSMVSAFRNVSVNVAGEAIVVSPNSSGTAKLLALRQASPKVEEERLQARERMSRMALNLQQTLGPLVKEGKVHVTEGVQGISVEINASLLFAPGDAQLGGGAVSVLRAVAQILASNEYPVTVEGHTDNTPISTSLFPSNWELSVVRASTVVRLFQDSGVAPWRLTATGYGEQRPVASNATPEGKARNRRVNITIDAPVGPEPVPLSDPAKVAPGQAPAAGTPNQVAPAQPAATPLQPPLPDKPVPPTGAGIGPAAPDKSSVR